MLIRHMREAIGRARRFAETSGARELWTQTYVEDEARVAAIITDDNEDGSPAFTFDPWTDGHAMGYKVTRHSDGAITYVYLNPSQETWSDGKFHPDVFVYMGPNADPGAGDSPMHFYNVEFPED